MSCKENDNRAEINATQIRHELPDTAQNWIMYAAKNGNGHPHCWLPWVDDAKGNEPPYNNIGEQGPDIDVDDLVNQDDESIHVWSLVEMTGCFWRQTIHPTY